MRHIISDDDIYGYAINSLECDLLIAAAASSENTKNGGAVGQETRLYFNGKLPDK
jgi:hypothetical protein